MSRLAADRSSRLASMRKPANDRMQKYWAERARLNAAWCVDTSPDFEAPDMGRLLKTGERIVAHVLERAQVSAVEEGMCA